MKTEAAVACKTLESIHQTEQHHIPVECNLDITSSDNILSALQNKMEEEMCACRRGAHYLPKVTYVMVIQFTRQMSGIILIIKPTRCTNFSNLFLE